MDPKLRELTNSSRNSCDYCCDGSSPEEVVITGISGRFPLTDNIQEFSDALYSKRNLILACPDRWSQGTLGLIEHHGAVNDISKFDSEFFNIPNCIAKNVEPEQRLLMEVCYEAICDAGYDPHSLRGKDIGVYCASTTADGREIFIRDADFDSYSGVGYLRSLRANRCSYAFDFVGPSITLDSACSSSAAAFSAAVQDLKSGRCSAALVSGCQVVLNPEVNVGYMKCGIHTKTGLTYPFDERASGMIRTDATAAIFLQKACDARRVYAKLINFQLMASGFTPDGVYVPYEPAHMRLFKKTYEDSGVSPLDIGFVEAHGTGTFVGDPIELDAVAKFFCKGRKKPLLVGTVKSNVGHTEAAAGLCGIIKSILAFETGFIAPNINYSIPNPSSIALVEGTIQVVTEPMPYTGQYIGVNCFGFGGCNSHILIKKNTLEYEEKPKHTVPHLTLFSASSEHAVHYALNHIMKSSFLPREFFSLLHESAYTPLKNAPFRGYAVLNEEPVPEVQHCNLTKRPVWFVVTGMGCQWPGMGLDLMQLETFAKSMRRSAEVLQPFGIDLLELLRSDKDHLLQNRRITPAFVTICSIQIALIDVLRELDIHPDGIVGHSTGELVCAYADGCCTAEQTILSAYYRGKTVESSNLAAGEMAAVGLSWAEAKKLCPENVYPACHNAEDSVTISGLTKPLEDFVSQLKKENVFARVVNAYGYGFHCPLVKPASHALKLAMDEIITSPKIKTKRWLSTSYPPEEWDCTESNLIDSTYFVHNLMSNVHFAEALKYIPSNAITIEIGPHFLLQAILKRVIGSGAAYLGLMKRHDNNVNFLLSSIGKMYTLGLDPKIDNLYPPVKYPVPRGTPRVCDLIKWNHSYDWPIPRYVLKDDACSTITIKPSDGEAYLLDHCIEGRSLFPATGYIVLAWKSFAKIHSIDIEEFPIVVEHFKILRPTILTATESKSFKISFLNVGGEFEVVEGGSVVSTGKISTSKEIDFQCEVSLDQYTDCSDMVSGAELYSELKIHGYEYGPAFQCLAKASIDGTKGLLKWSDEWISYLDSHLLFFGLLQRSHEFCLPTAALSIKLDPVELLSFAKTLESKQLEGMPVGYDDDIKCCYSPGVEIRELQLEPAPHRTRSDIQPILEEYHFIPYVESSALHQDQKQTYLEYINLCNDLVKDITKFVTGASKPSACKSSDCSEKIESWKKSQESDDYILLNLLEEISKLESHDILVQNSNKIFDKYLRTTSGDILHKTLYKERPLRNLLDIIAENSLGKLDVVEVLNSEYSLLPELTDMMKCYCHAKLSCCVQHPDPDLLLEEQIFSERNIEVKKLEQRSCSKDTKKYDVIVGSFLFGDNKQLQDYVQNLKTFARDGSYIIFYCKVLVSPAEAFLSSLCNKSLSTQNEKELGEAFNAENLTVLSEKSDGLGSMLYLLRSEPKEVTKTHHVVCVKDHEFGAWVDELRKTMSSASENDNVRVWMVAQDSACNGILGLVNCLKQEPGGDKIICVFTPNEWNSTPVPPFNLNDKFYQEVLKRNLLMNVYKNGVWGSFKHLTFPIGPKMKVVDHSLLNCMKYGDLSSFRWLESPLKYKEDPCSCTAEFIHVCYSSLNFRDVMIATGKLNAGFAVGSLGYGLSVLGIEFAGITAEGRRVMGSLGSQAMTTAIQERVSFLLDVPDHWSLEQAATVPVVYLTAYYALFDRARIQRKESILIHSGSGGVGIAIIRISLSLDCEVFVTVGTEEKRRYLRKMFPQIKEENIGCSHDTTFEHLVRRRTKGKGVDIVCNSLAEDKLYASTRCLAQSGRFIEIGKYDMALNHNLGLQMFLKNITFHGVFLDNLFGLQKSIVERANQCVKWCYEGIRKGVVQPLDRTVFDKDDVEQAFRYMASGKHVGKVLLKIRDEPKKGIIPPVLKQLAIPSSYFYAYKSYVVVGGLGGFGVELVNWMIHKGARNVVLTSRYGARTPYHHMCLKRWKNVGVNVKVSVLNVAKKTEAKQLILEVSEIAPIGGIFNSAVVLKDAFMENQTTENYVESCAPKATATKHLDELTRQLCPALDVFVCFSSISCGKGNAGQTNYGYANSTMERICEKRRSDGLHGLAIQWGIIGEVGVVHRHMGEDAMIAGVVAQNIKSCLKTLEQFLLQDHPVVCSYVNADLTKRKKSKEDDLVTQIAKVFGYKDGSEMHTDRSLREMGMDSMIGVELQQVLEANHDLTISIQDLQQMKIGDIQALVDNAKFSSASKEAESPKVISVKLTIPENFMSKANIVPLNKSDSGVPSFIVHHSELQLATLGRLASEVTTPVYGLTCTKDTPMDSLRSLAVAYLKQTATVARTQSINLIGLSSAASLTLEMAVCCQTMSTASLPKIKSLAVLNGSMSLLSSIASDGQGEFTNELESEILCKFLSQFTEQDLTELQQSLAGKPDYESRLKVVEGIVCSSSGENVNKNDMTEAANIYLRVERLLSKFSANQKIAGDITIIESTSQLLPNDVTVVKSSLSKISSGKVHIHRVQGGDNFLQDKETYSKVADILNKTF